MDVVRREIYDGELIVTDGRISSIRQCSLPDSMEPWPYLMPGFIDSHVHIESSMMLPAEFARVASEHGTIGAIADPHEIANVMGVEGVDVMIHSASQAQFNFLFGAPSCVPALGGDVETSGATIGSQEIAALMQRDDIGFLAEMSRSSSFAAQKPSCSVSMRMLVSCGDVERQMNMSLSTPISETLPGTLMWRRIQAARTSIARLSSQVIIAAGFGSASSHSSILKVK